MDKNTVCDMYNRYSTEIFRFALTMVRETEEASDIMQETFLRALEENKLRYVNGTQRAWLYKVTRNLCYDRLRRRKKEGDFLFTADEVLTPAPESPSQAEFILILSALDELNRQIVSLKIIGNLTHAEIAGVMGMTVHAVKKRYERSLRKLKEIYVEQGY
ncbi:MAG: sigma-70 family RNA polymerase sigma factor [Eubacteriaceae bacterium]|nr:sigma-70 family RNA polymerase sigma factor [Eubacteriaceae bacterium]